MFKKSLKYNQMRILIENSHILKRKRKELIPEKQNM